MNASPERAKADPSAPDAGSLPTGVVPQADPAPAAARREEGSPVAAPKESSPAPSLSTSAPTTIEPAMTPPPREPDRPVRAQELRAAARSPSEIADALAREARAKKKKAEKAAKAAPAEAGAAAQETPPPPAALHVAGATPAGGVKLLKDTQAAPPLAGAVISRPPATKVASPRPEPGPPEELARGESARPVPSAPRGESPHPRAVARGDMPSMPDPKTSGATGPYSWLLGAALVLQIVLLGVLARGLAHAELAIDRLAERANAPVDTHPSAPAVSSAPADPRHVAPSVASLGEGRVVYATADGKIIELKRDPVSNELTVSRVYALEQDESKNAGDDGRKAYSGYYLVDLEQSRKHAVAAAEATYRDALAHFVDRSDGLDQAQEAARNLASAGGADKLIVRLEDKDAIARRTSAIALGERGYIHAIPVLVQVLEGTSDAKLAEAIALLLRDLTELPLDPANARTTVASDATKWYLEHKPADRFARRLGHGR